MSQFQSKGSILLVKLLFQKRLADLPEMLKRFPEGSPGNLFVEFRRPLAVWSFGQILTLHEPPAQLNPTAGPSGWHEFTPSHHTIYFIPFEDHHFVVERLCFFGFSQNYR